MSSLYKNKSYKNIIMENNSKIDGFGIFPVTTAYIIYELRVEDTSIVFKKLSTALKLKQAFKDFGKSNVRVFKRIGFLDKDQIFSTNGRSYSIDIINKNENIDFVEFARVISTTSYN